MFNQVTILGPGLLGASLAQAIRARGLASSIRVWAHRAETRVACENAAWCDGVHASAAEAVKGSDLVVLATPVQVIVELLGEIGSEVDPEALVTDVGSTKSLICRTGRSVVRPPARFIGSHPMAGSEKTGWRHADPNLFENRACFITPVEEDEDPPEAAARDMLARFWTRLGMDVETVNPELHDEIVAHISHLPHMLASVLCAYLAGRPEEWADFAGQGLKDTTRIAEGSPTLWRSIVEQNREEILRALHGFQEELHALERVLHNREDFRLQRLLERGRDYRTRLPGPRGAGQT